MSLIEYTMNYPCCGRAIHESWLCGTGHSKMVTEPMDASICLILLSSVLTKRWLLNQSSPCHGLTSTLISSSKHPSSLAQTQMDCLVAVVIWSPHGEYLAVSPSGLPWLSVCTFLHAVMSQIMATLSGSSVETSQVESGKKSTLQVVVPILSTKTCS